MRPRREKKRDRGETEEILQGVARWRARTWVQVLLLARWGMRQDVTAAWARCGFSVAPAEGFTDWWGVAFVYLWGVAWRH